VLIAGSGDNLHPATSLLRDRYKLSQVGEIMSFRPSEFSSAQPSRRRYLRTADMGRYWAHADNAIQVLDHCQAGVLTDFCARTRYWI
jgi:hypothetical protein